MREKPTYEELEKELETLKQKLSALENNKQNSIVNRYNELEQIAQLGYWELDIINNKLYWSDQIYRIFELEPQQFSANYEAFIENIHPKDREKVDAAYTNSLKNKKPYEIEHRVLLKNGQLKHVIEKCRTEYDSVGNPLRSIGMILDITVQKNTELALKENEGKLKAITENIPNAMLITDVHGNITDSNLRATSQLAYSKAELLKMNVAQLNLPEEKDTFKKITKKFKEERPETLHFETVHQTKDKKKIEVEINTSVFAYKGETNILSISRDVTERNRVQKALNESNTKFKTIFDNSPVGIFYYNNKGLIVDCNDYFVKIMGSSKDVLVGLNTSRLPNKKLVQEIKKSLNKGEGFYNGYYTSVTSGKITFVKALFEGIKDHSNKINSGIGIVEDITIQKQAELALKESEKNFRLLFEKSPLGTYTALPDGKILEINQSALNMIGLPSVEATKQINVLTFPPLVENAYADHFLKCVKTGKIVTKEMLYKSKWGKQAFLSSYIVPLKNDEGKVVKVYTIMEDITDRKKAEKDMKESEAKLQESNKTKDKFFSIIAHDLKSPFNAMLGFSNLLVKNHAKYDEHKRKRFLEIINRDIQNTYNLLENLLLWSHSQRGAIAFNPFTENLYLLYLETYELLYRSAKNKSIKLINKIPENINVFADKSMILTVLRNLISNAIKFTPEGGTVQIGVKTRHVVETRHSLSLTEIYVKDNGVGIPKESIEQLFEISENVSTSGTDGEKGTGLGLIICKEFVEEHGGAIWVESEEDKGSTFIFTLLDK